MLFNSWLFVAFFAVVYPIYRALGRRHRAQNAFLLVASLAFYAAWDWRFLGLLLLSSGVDFFAAIKIKDAEAKPRKKAFLVVSLVSNLTILGVFKYFDFFSKSAAALLHAAGMKADLPTLAIALPVGISFYTFQAMAYSIDVYRGELEPVRSPLDYLLFIAFFPHLVAGPIQRTSILIPQVVKPRTIEWRQVHAGVYLLLWGYIKKVVLADNMALVADPIFDHWKDHAGLDLLLGALAFTFQIYGDFSGYSDIARGLSKLLGFELMTNFKLPYFALDPSDFWRRWHVSLSTWLRDYLYIPLGGSRATEGKTLRNLVLTMILGGLWHGASWNFVLWGAYHGVLLVTYRLVERRRAPGVPWEGSFGVLRTSLAMLLMFLLTVAGWVLFRARSLGQVAGVFGHLGLGTTEETQYYASALSFFALPIVVIEAWQYQKKDQLVLAKLPTLRLGALYGLMLVWICLFGVRKSIEFIYFQF